MLAKKTVETPIGILTLIASELGIKALLFPIQLGRFSKMISANDIGPLNRCNELPSHAEALLHLCKSNLLQCERELLEYFAGTRKAFSVSLDPDGTIFQKKVWSSLLEIEFGKTISYSQQAQSLGNPDAVRAVASANGRNPIPILIPCHRVIASSGDLQGYSGGLPIKKQLLQFEGVACDDYGMIAAPKSDHQYSSI